MVCCVAGIPSRPISRSRYSDGNMAIRELIKACCSAKQESRALSILKNASEKYSFKITDQPYEPLIFHMTKRGMMYSASDIMTLMTNAGIVPSVAILDAFTSGHLHIGAGNDAVEKLEECFNLYGVRPSAASLLKVLDHALLAHEQMDGSSEVDVYLAQRVASLIGRMYSAKERQHMHVRLSTTNMSMNKTRAESIRKEALRNHNAYKPAFDSQIRPGEQYTLSAVDEAAERCHREGERTSGGRVLKRPLSVDVIERRFAEAGVEMPQF